MTSERIKATYWIETPLSVEQASEAIAGEQSTGTFLAVPGEAVELRDRFQARVDEIEVLDEVREAALPGALQARDGRYRRARLVISWPCANVGANLPTLLTTVTGNLSELREISGVRLLDLDLPAAYAEAYPGPQFGVDGTRKLADVHGRPLVGTIIKPSVGLSPLETAEVVHALAVAGIDFIKDDELIANPPWSPLEDRLTAVTGAIERAAEDTGRKAMFAFNITDDLDAMLRHQDLVAGAGGTCVMVSVNSVGLSGVECLRRRARLPIHGHRNGFAMLNRHPSLGIEFTAYQKLWRLAGVDHLHVNGIQGKFWESDESVARSIRACLTHQLGHHPIMPAISSGQWGGQAPETYRLTRTVDVIYLSGGGILAHPGGPAAGVAAVRQAWEAAVAGISLAEYSKDRLELAAAIRTFQSMRRE